jgi:hypothetical protein
MPDPPGRELDSGRERGKVSLVPQRFSPLSAAPCRVSLGTMAAALAALSMAVLGHFFI